VIIVLSPEAMHRLAELSARLADLTEAEAVEWHQLHLATIPKAIEPYYSLATPSAVPLYAGLLLLPSRAGGTAEHVDGTVSLQLTPHLHVLIRAAIPRVLVIQDLLDWTPAPELPPMPGLPEPPGTPSETGDTSWLGPARGWVVGKSAAANAVTFHLVNFVEMDGGRITDGESVWPGRVVVHVGPWIVTINARSDLRGVLQTLRASGGYAVTHTCRLERRDGRAFSVARCQQLLTCLTWCLWFCRASAPAVVLPVGLDASGRAMWSRWAAPHTDPLPDRHWHWFDEAYGAEQLSTLLPLFYERWGDPAWQATLPLAVRYYAEAAVMGTLERNVILAQVALESLAFAHLVRSSKQLEAGQFTAPVSRHIRRFLDDVGIPTTIPRTFYGLRRVRASAPWDGPAAIAWLRNDIVHAARRRVHGRRRSKVWYQGWQLSLWYLELAVLAAVKYEGRYRNRLAGVPATGAVEPVPWVKKRRA
jgi:hypothetical protein